MQLRNLDGLYRPQPEPEATELDRQRIILANQAAVLRAVADHPGGGWTDDVLTETLRDLTTKVANVLYRETASGLYEHVAAFSEREGWWDKLGVTK